jgi:hypothetical protein
MIDDPALADLLGHYARLSQPDRQRWHPRHGPEDAPPRQTARLHGELIAEGLLEQNTGVLTPGSYRITRAGLKALERIEE